MSSSLPHLAQDPEVDHRDSAVPLDHRYSGRILVALGTEVASLGQATVV